MIAKQGWTDLGTKADIWGGINRQVTCRAGPNAKPTRIDFVLANEAIFPAIKGFQVDYCNMFKTHHVMPVRIEAENLKQDVTRYRKTTSASKIIEKRINETADNNPNKTPEDIRKFEMAGLHGKISQAFQTRHERLVAAERAGDTTKIWKMISSAAEEGFIEHLQLEGNEAKNMRGRGTPHFMKTTIDPALPIIETIEKGSAALHRSASRHGTQATRLGHIAANGKSINGQHQGSGINDAEARKLKKHQQIDKTLQNYAKDTDLDNLEETRRKDRIEEIGAGSWQSYPIIKRAEAWHQKKQDAIRSQAFEAARGEKAFDMACKKKGAKKISAALNPTAASPLLYARRDRVGLKGEAIGTIATDPKEVDGIATRKWTAIYDGNFDELDEQAKIFMENYKSHIVDQKAYKVDKITGHDVEIACKEARPSAAGLDNWEPAELGLLCTEAYHWIAVMFNKIEEGYPWPEGSEHVRAAYLAKDANRSADPLAYRVLMLLPAMNRVWGSMRLKHLRPWTDSWGMSEFYAGNGNQGAEDAWYAIAGEVEQYKLGDEDFVGGTVDIAKCFDQISRQLLYRLASKAGMPPQILNAYIKYQDSLKVHNTIAKGIGQAFSRKCGIPQGCPFSMMFSSLTMKPWMMQCKSTSPSIVPKILADDIIVVVHGKDCLDTFVKALDETHEYIKQMGGKLAEGKSINFASNPEHREWLRQSRWEATGKEIKVENDFRYLGSHFNASGKRKSTTNIGRLKNGVVQCGKLKRLPIDRATKAKTIRTKIFPAAFYAAEVVEMPDCHVAKLTTAVIKVMTNKGSHHDVDSTFASCSHGDDLDPSAQILMRCCTALRRAIAKKPHNKSHYQRTHETYVKKGMNGATVSCDKDAQSNGELADLQPAPHPTQSDQSRAAWRTGQSPEGPIGHLIRAVHMIGGKMNGDFEILINNEAPIGILDTPYQFLGKAVLAAVARSRTRAAHGTKKINEHICEIDVKATLGMQSKMPVEDRGYLHTIQTDSGWGKIDLAKIGATDNDICDLCGIEAQCTDHSIWFCKALENERKEANAMLSCINPHHIHQAIRRGIAPAMSTQPDEAFWGGIIPQRLDDKVRKMLGARSPPIECGDARSIISDAEGLHCNARQLVAVCRGGFGQGKAPDFPEGVIGKPGNKPNVFSDGGVKNPANQLWALGGFGIWMQCTGEEENHAPSGSGNQLLYHERRADQDIARWEPLAGFWH